MVVRSSTAAVASEAATEFGEASVRCRWGRCQCPKHRCDKERYR